MKTFILLTPKVGGDIVTEDVFNLVHFIGLMNVDRDATDEDVPGAVMYGTLTEDQKEMLKNRMFHTGNRNIATFFIEYEDKDEDNFSNTLIHKPKNNERE